MERIPVSSSTLSSIGYDPETYTLEVEFLKGGVYQYYNVPGEIFEQFLHAGSKGTFLDQNIKKTGYAYNKVG